MLAIGDRQFITIERSFAIGAATPGVAATTNGLPTGNTIRLFYADAREATDVSGLNSIVGQPITPVKKQLLLDLSTLKHDDGSVLALDNIEGLTFGPMVDGKRTLILVSDNNFGPNQFTQFVATRLNNTPQTTGPLLIDDLAVETFPSHVWAWWRCTAEPGALAALRRWGLDPFRCLGGVARAWWIVVLAAVAGGSQSYLHAGDKFLLCVGRCCVRLISICATCARCRRRGIGSGTTTTGPPAHPPPPQRCRRRRRRRWRSCRRCAAWWMGD
jgi:hypothetical protein